MPYRETDLECQWEARLAAKEAEIDRLRAAHWAAKAQLEELRALRASATVAWIGAVGAAASAAIVVWSLVAMVDGGPSWAATGWMTLAALVGVRCTAAMAVGMAPRDRS